MNCPHCKQGIDDDSLFCDQCGGEILVCSVCGRPGTGKRCIFDGSPLVKPTATPGASGPGAQAAPAQPASPVAPATPGTPAGQNVPPSPALPGDNAAKTVVADDGTVLRIVGAPLGVDIRPSDGDVLGRKTGAFVGQFGRFPQVSGTHARFSRCPGGWQVEDLGSTNGTKVDGERLAPHAPHRLSHGAVLRIADLDFRVEVSGSAS